VEINTEELLLAETKKGHTALHLAAEMNKVETLKKLWLWAEETQINSKEMKKKLLLATNGNGYTAWHLAVAEGNLEVLETLWCFSKEAKLNTYELLLAKTED
jgi:ankyrin repeat protein